MGVLGKFLRCFKNVSRDIEMCSYRPSMVSKRSKRVFQGSFKAVSKTNLESFLGV